MLQVQFASPWALVTPQPYRYLDRRYVEDFFRDGSLRLSSFARFAEHEDEQRRDETEGKTGFVARTTTGPMKTIATRIEMGFNAYVLCGSSYYSEELAELFGCDSYFRIDSTLEFANAVSRHVPGFFEGVEGLCMYQENPGILRDSDTGFSLPTEKHDGQETYDPADLQRIREYVLNSARLQPLFLKNAKYAKQAEYRLLWFTRSTVAPFLDIKVPEAGRFCSPPPDLVVSREGTSEEELRRNAMTLEEFESHLEPGTFEKILPRGLGAEGAPPLYRKTTAREANPDGGKGGQSSPRRVPKGSTPQHLDLVRALSPSAGFFFV